VSLVLHAVLLFGYRLSHPPVHEQPARTMTVWLQPAKPPPPPKREQQEKPEIAKAAPADTEIVKAFNTLNAHVLAAGPVEGHPLDVFIAGDGVQAKARVSVFVESLGLRSMDAGPLSMARALEHACMLVLGLVTHAVKHTNFSIGVKLLD